MSQERWKYWIDESGTACINESDMPPRYLGDLRRKPYGIGYRSELKLNPDYRALMDEIYRITGKWDIKIIKGK